MLGQCHCCGYENIEVKSYTIGSIDRGHAIASFCEICAKTFISNAYTYNYENYTLYITIGWIANHIMKKLEEINGKLNSNSGPSTS